MASRFHPELTPFVPETPKIFHTERIKQLGSGKPKAWSIWNDLFHETVPEDFILKTISRINGSKDHLFLILTKRPERMVDICIQFGLYPSGLPAPACFTPSGETWPLNAWPGFTAENQEYFDKRWEHARKIPTFSGIFLSYEPALGPLVLPDDFLKRGKRAWVICGGESGTQARPMHPDWARNVRDQCVSAGVPFFFKQHGEFTGDRDRGNGKISGVFVGNNYVHGYGNIQPDEHPECLNMYRVGKLRAGRQLDGRTWNEHPDL